MLDRAERQKVVSELFETSAGMVRRVLSEHLVAFGDFRYYVEHTVKHGERAGRLSMVRE